MVNKPGFIDIGCLMFASCCIVGGSNSDEWTSLIRGELQISHVDDRDVMITLDLDSFFGNIVFSYLADLRREFYIGKDLCAASETEILSRGSTP